MRTGMIALGLAATVLAGAAAARDTAGPAGPAVAAGDAAQVVAGRRAAFLMSAALMGQIKGAIDRGDEVNKVGFAARSIAAWAKALPGMFPAGSDAAPSEALPNVWSDRAGFEAKAAAYAAAADKLADLAKAGDKPGFAAQFAALGATCDGCHQTYRKPQQR